MTFLVQDKGPVFWFQHVLFRNESSCVGNTAEYYRKWKSWILNFGDLLFTYQTIQSIILKPCFCGIVLVFDYSPFTPTMRKTWKRLWDSYKMLVHSFCLFKSQIRCHPKTGCWPLFHNNPWSLLQLEYRIVTISRWTEIPYLNNGTCKGKISKGGNVSCFLHRFRVSKDSKFRKHLAECFLMGLCGEHERKTPPTFNMNPEKVTILKRKCNLPTIIFREANCSTSEVTFGQLLQIVTCHSGSCQAKVTCR